MKQYCINHPDKKALSLCHSCAMYFCTDCLNEGLEYYYCSNDECNKMLTIELSKRKIIKAPVEQLSNESKFIKRVATGFIILSSIVLFYFIINLSGILYFALGSSLDSSPADIKINIVGYYMFKYLGIILIICFLVILYSLVSSIKLYQLKNRKFFLYALIFNIILVITYNVFIYSYLDFVRETNIVALGYERYKSFWSIEKYYTGIISLLIVLIFIYLIKKLSSENIKKGFIKSNANLLKK